PCFIADPPVNRRDVLPACPSDDPLRPGVDDIVGGTHKFSLTVSEYEVVGQGALEGVPVTGHTVEYVVVGELPLHRGNTAIAGPAGAGIGVRGVTAGHNRHGHIP